MLGTGTSDALRFGALGGSLVIVPGRAWAGELSVDIQSLSTQPSEPLLGRRPPVGDPGSQARIAP